MSVVAYIWRKADGAFAAHEAVITCELAFALKIKGLIEHLDPRYAVTFTECAGYEPLHTTRPVVTREVLAKVNDWLKDKGFPPVSL